VNFKSFNIPRQIVYTILPLALIIMGDSILYVILPTNYEFFEINAFLGIPFEFWIGFILSINRFVRFFSNIYSTKIIRNIGFRNSILLACVTGASSTLSYALFKGVVLIVIARIVWGFSYSIFRLSYQLKVFSYDQNNFGKYLGFCLGVQRLGSFFVVTIGVIISVKFGNFLALLLLSTLLIPALFITLKIKDIDTSNFAAKKINWNLFYADQNKSRRNNIIMISFFKFSSSFTSNGLAIATITPFLFDINNNLYSKPLIISIAGFVVGFRWIADIFFGIIFGAISDKFGRNINIILSTILMLISIILAIMGLSFVISVVCIILMFFFSVALETSLDALLGEISPKNDKPSIVSRYSTWQDLGAAFGPILGFLFAINLGITFGYYFSIILIGLSLIFYFLSSTNREN